MDLDSMKSDNPDDLWYRYKKPTERSLDHYPKFTPNSEVHLSKTYSPVAYKHLKNMAKFCNYNWGNDKCMQSLSALGIAVTKDYLKKIHNSKVAPSDLIEPSKKTLKEGCAGILLRAGGNIEPIQMSNGMKECVGTMTEISNALNEYPDMELRQLALSSTFCIVRQPKCKIIEGQLEMIAKPQMASIKPESNQEDEPVETGQGNDTQAEQ